MVAKKEAYRSIDVRISDVEVAVRSAVYPAAVL